ncbi:MAG TPA: prepilin-type N-terminal cleavage/methylation domain-containing protein [Longimicrobiales bacterium]|nr:prepilin-type N-terminal cleavage/methylation domain-containing protein [Longimicrobiales bacterium]
MMRSGRPEGFTVIEMLVALVVLSVGLLAMASVMGTLILQTRAADIRTERSFAVQQAAERLRAQSFSAIADRAEADAVTVGSYDVWWTVAGATSIKRQIEVFTKGPGYVPGNGFIEAKLDTFQITLARID